MTVSFGEEMAESGRHRLLIMRYKKPTGIGRNMQNLRIRLTSESSFIGSLEIERFFAATDPFNDSAIKIGIGKKPDLHFCFWSSELRLACSSLR